MCSVFCAGTCRWTKNVLQGMPPRHFLFVVVFFFLLPLSVFADVNIMTLLLAIWCCNIITCMHQEINHIWLAKYALKNGLYPPTPHPLHTQKKGGGGGGEEKAWHSNQKGKIQNVLLPYRVNFNIIKTESGTFSACWIILVFAQSAPNSDMDNSIFNMCMWPFCMRIDMVDLSS